MLRPASLVALMSAFAACGGHGGSRPVPVAHASSPCDHLPALAGDYFRIESRHVGRGYHVHVRLPQGYDSKAARRYPVVYLLDGDSLFPLLAPTHLFLTYDERLPEAIVVGIAYGGFDPSINKRDVDFSSPSADAPAGEGGAPAFLKFLARELIPAVEARYRVDASRRVLLGQSRGATFALWSALVSGSRDTALRRRDALEWTQAWSGRSDAPWKVRLLPIEGGTHAASIGEAYRRALLAVPRRVRPPG